MATRLLLFCALALVLAGPVRAQQTTGYMDLREIESWFDEEAKIEVNIEGPLMRLVAAASEGEDPEYSGLLAKLEAIHVRGYTVHSGEFASTERRMRGLAGELRSRGWSSVVRVREDEDVVEMLVQTDAETIAGIVVMVLSPDEDEAVIVNIVGDIDPEEIGRIGSKFRIHGLDY